jgi:hypothetical protein
MTPLRSLKIASRLLFALVGTMIAGAWLYQKLGLSFLPPIIALHMVPVVAAVATIVGLGATGVGLSRRTGTKINAIQTTAIGKRRRMNLRIAGALFIFLPIVLIIVLAVSGLGQRSLMHSVATLGGYLLVAGIALIAISFYAKDS